jgi:hypothetical protein
VQRLRETRAICRRCNAAHPAEVVIRDGKVIGITHCPAGRDEVELSSNPALYMTLTGRSPAPPDAPPAAGLKHVLNYISVTNACNFHCTVCCTDAGGKDKCTFLRVDEIGRRARLAYDAGGRILHLFGGEPTLHPDLETIVRRLADMGLSVGLVTNGLELGRRPELAAQLKACGLKRVCLQFDSLEHAPLSALARDFLQEKRRAIRHAIAAGLDVGLNCTATQQTLPELGALVEHGVSLGVRVRNMTFGCAAPIGRFMLSPDTLVDREQIVDALLRTGGERHFTLDDILPLPCYLPWGLQVHPDCGVHILLLRQPGGATALNRLLDLPRLYARLARSRATGALAVRFAPGWHMLRSVRPGRWRALLAAVAGLLFRKDRYGIMNIGISDYRAAQFLDEQRLRRCASAFHTAVGPVQGCLHFYQRADVPGSLAYEAAHQSC